MYLGGAAAKQQQSSSRRQEVPPKEKEEDADNQEKNDPTWADYSYAKHRGHKDETKTTKTETTLEDRRG